MLEQELHLRADFTALPTTKKLDRKSTRLNSSHGYISYAVFCLKKKKKETKPDTYNNQPSRASIRKAIQKSDLSAMLPGDIALARSFPANAKTLANPMTSLEHHE